MAQREFTLERLDQIAELITAHIRGEDDEADIGTTRSPEGNSLFISRDSLSAEHYERISEMHQDGVSTYDGETHIGITLDNSGASDFADELESRMNCAFRP